MSECSAILEKGIYEEKEIIDNQYSKLLFIKKLKSYSKKEADSKYEGSLDVILEGLPIGAKYSEGQYNLWLKQLEKEEILQTYSQYEKYFRFLSINDKLVQAWKECVLKRTDGAFDFKITQRNDEIYSLIITFVPYQAFPKARPSIFKNPSLKNLEFLNPNDALSKGDIIHSGTNTYPLVIKDLSKDSYIGIDVKIGEFTPPDTDFLIPKIKTIPSIPSDRKKFKYRYYHWSDLWRDGTIKFGDDFTIPGWIEDQTGGSYMLHLHLEHDGGLYLFWQSGFKNTSQVHRVGPIYDLDQVLFDDIDGEKFEAKFV